MKYTVVSYYDEFHCIGGSCEDSCCENWEIDLDDDSVKKYLHQKGCFGKRLKANMRVKEKQFILNGTRCPFLNEENLCDIYIEMGEESLCETCTNFPRHIEEFDDLKEVSLTMSCPEASRIMLAKDEKMEFVTKDGCDEDYGLKVINPKKSRLFFGKKNVNKLDQALFEILEKARKILFDVLQNRQLSVEKRAVIVLLYGEQMQNLFNQKDYTGLREFVGNNAFDLEYKGAVSDFLETKKWLYQVLNMYEGLEVIKDEWSKLLVQGMECDYRENDRKEFERYLGNRQYEFEHILVYYMFNYFLGASYDGDILTKVKMSVISYLVIRQLDIAYWKQNQKTFTYEDQVFIAHAYSKEVEHSYNNFESLQLVLSAHPLLDVEHLICGLKVL